MFLSLWVCVALSRTCTGCRDPGLTELIYQLTKDNTNVLMDLEHWLVRLLREVFRRCRVGNVLSEDRFARITSALAYRAGGHVKSSHFGSRHTLSETASQWAHAVRDYAVKTAQTGPLVEENCTSAWMLYFQRQRRADSTTTMAVAASRWDKMSPLERAVEERRFSTHQRECRQRKAAPAMPASATPHEMGTHEWPVAPEFLADHAYSGRMSVSEKAWHAECGKLVPVSLEAAAAEESEPPDHYLCGELYGPDECERRLAADVALRVARIKKMLALIGRYYKATKKKLSSRCGLDTALRVRASLFCSRHSCTTSQYTNSLSAASVLGQLRLVASALW